MVAGHFGHILGLKSSGLKIGVAKSRLKIGMEETRVKCFSPSRRQHISNPDFSNLRFDQEIKKEIIVEMLLQRVPALLRFWD